MPVPYSSRPGKLRADFIGFCALLLAIDFWLYFRHIGHFFQADSIFLLVYRVHSVAGYFQDFLRLHPSGWYRPLPNELVESIFYPVFGLSPAPYRIPIYLLFLGITAALYALVLAMTGRRLAAAISTLFFSIHTVNAYLTYDLSDMTELAYTLFYILAALAFLRYLQRGEKWAYGASLLCFVAALCSKEASVTLPGTLLVLHFLKAPEPGGVVTRCLRAIRSILPHALVLAAYMVFALGFLHVTNGHITKVFDRPQEGLGYQFVLDKTILTNAEFASSWAFNIPRGYWATWQNATSRQIEFLRIFRTFILLMMLVLLFTAERKAVLFGMAWFIISVLPALPLLNHFIPYYLFLPIMGLSLSVGTAFAWTYDALNRVKLDVWVDGRFARAVTAPRTVVTAIIILMFAGELSVTSRMIRGDIRGNPLLGGSAQTAYESLNDLKALYPAVPPKAKLFFNDSSRPLYWEHSWGNLLKMVYHNDDIQAQYASLGDAADPKIPDTIFLNMENGHLADRTSEFHADPMRFASYVDSKLYKLRLSTSKISVGESYEVLIGGAHDIDVRIAYTVNNGTIETFAARLDERGRAAGVPLRMKGSCKIIGFQIAGQTEWVRSDETVEVE